MDGYDEAIRQILDGYDYLILYHERALLALKKAREMIEARTIVPMPSLGGVLRGESFLPPPEDVESVESAYTVDLRLDLSSDGRKENGERNKRKLAHLLYENQPQTVQDLAQAIGTSKDTVWVIFRGSPDYFVGVDRKWSLTDNGRNWIEKYLVKKEGVNGHEFEGSGFGNRNGDGERGQGLA